MHERLRHRWLGWWSRLVTNRPRSVLGIALLLAGACIVTTVTNLTFQPNRNDLISPNLPWNQRFIRWQEHFSGHGDLVVAVDAAGPEGEVTAESRKRARAVVDELGPKLEALSSTEDVAWGFDPHSASPRLLRLQPMPEFEATLEQVRSAEAVLTSPTPTQLVQQVVAEARADATAAGDPAAAEQAISGLRRLIDAFTARLRTEADEPLPLLDLTQPAGGLDDWQYLATPNGRLLLIRITPRGENGQLTLYDQAIRDVRRMLTRMRLDNPAVAMGLTGIEVIEQDETAAATRDSTIASLLAIAAIAVLLMLAFHSVRTPLLLLVALLVGIAWSFGFLTLGVGHLQVISVVFTAILLGLGVDFGIHLAARYERVRHDHPDTKDGFADTLQDVFERVGPGVVTGAVTTSVALGTTLLTDFKGVAEMGLIAGVGILLCLVAMFSVFPAMMRLFKWRHRHLVSLQDRWVHFFEESWVRPAVHHPIITLLVAAAIGGLATFKIADLRFSYDLTSLLPRDLPSLVWAKRIETLGEQSIYFGVTLVDDMTEARSLADRFRGLERVEKVGGVGLLVPEDDPAKLARLAEVREQMGPALASAADPTPQPVNDSELVGELTRLRTLLAAAGVAAPEALRPPLNAVGAAITEFLQTCRALPEAEQQRRLAALRDDYTRWRADLAQQVRTLLSPDPLEPDDLPGPVIRPYVGMVDGHQKLAMEIYPRLPAGIDSPLDPRFLGPFVEDLKSVDPSVTGVMVQVYESGQLIWTSYRNAGLYALAAVLVLVWFDFRSVRDAVLCVVPVAIGFATTFGIVAAVGGSINAANIIVLPLMFGIGVDAGVHILHRWRQHPEEDPPGLSGGTGKGISLTSYTTMLGFGSLLIASHRGVQSLGIVMVTGIGMTLLSCWFVLPSILTLLNRRRPANPGS